jgi:lysophospholipase L1-like esterase
VLAAPAEGAASLLYRNHDVDFPDWAGRDLVAAGYTAKILARDGAPADDVLRRQLPQLDAAPDLITITMGGNDLLAVFGDDPAAEAAVGRVRAVGEGVLIRLRPGGDACRIVLTTAYDPSDGSVRAAGSGLVAWPQEPRWVRLLNAVLAGLAERHGAVLVDVHGLFHGHGAAVGNPAQTDARPDNRGLW